PASAANTREKVEVRVAATPLRFWPLFCSAVDSQVPRQLKKRARSSSTSRVPTVVVEVLVCQPVQPFFNERRLSMVYPQPRTCIALLSAALVALIAGASRPSAIGQF